MKIIKALVHCVVVVSMCLALCIGYAGVAEKLSIWGSAELTPPMPDVYINSITPERTTGVTINATEGTVMFASIGAQGTATFTIEVINISNKVYVYERVIDGAEIGIDGIYSGTDIKYSLSNISFLDVVEPNGGTITFNVTITVPRGVTTDAYALKFNFIEKTGTEILPGNDEYDVTFKYNNGQPDETVSVHENDFVPRPVAPIKDGYTFIGWYTDSACSKAWNFEIDRVSSQMTLYAGWHKNAIEEYIVTFKSNDGNPDRILLVPAGSLIPSQAIPTLEGYTFIGWYTDTSWNTAWNFDTDKVNSNITLYGGWEIYVPPVPPDCNITFKPNNGEPDTTIVVLTGEFIPRPNVPVREGYTFIGWYTDEACTNAWNFEVNKVEYHTVLYGGWEEEELEELAEYSITFKPNNSEPDITVTVEEGSLIPRPTLPTKTGYTFIGWYTDSGCTVGWNFDTDYPTGDMTLYGGWEKTSSTGGNEMHSDFYGLVEALLSDSNNCLNDNDLIFDSVMESLTSKKRPKEDAPILHCSVNSVSGGTMSAIASYANSNLTSDLHFIFEVDPDPQYQDSRLRLYMYYKNDVDNTHVGYEITVYQQILTRGSDGVWYADGTYIGVATVGNYYGGGNSGKDVKTISPYTWRSTALAVRESN